MAETKIIPLDLTNLRTLVFSHLFGPFHQKAYGMAGPRVVPLELAEVRKTQRRVAALLNLPFNGNCLCVKRGQLFPSDVCYICNQFNSYRRLWGAGIKKSKCPHLPPVPQNSFLGTEDSIENGTGIKAEFFDTSIFKEGTDPAGFKLPPVFSKNVVSREDDAGIQQEGRTSKEKIKKTRHSRIIPTVSERTFLNSNLRDQNPQEEADYSEDDYYNDFDNYQDDFIPEEDSELSDDQSNSRTRFPIIQRGQLNLVSSSWDGREAHEDDVIINTEPRAVTERTMTFDREKTGASLRIDEDYVPMNVFIKRFSERQASGIDTMHEYQDDLSSSISGSLGVSRETSLDDSDRSNSNPGGWCTCVDPITDDLPCPECLHPRTHEHWCTRKHESSGRNRHERICLVCGKRIQPAKTKKRDRPTHRKHSRNPDRRDSKNRQTPEKAPSRSNEHNHDRSTCSGKKGSGGHKKGSTSSLDLTNSDQHVRFSDQIQKVSPDNGSILPRTALDYDKMINYDHANSDSGRTPNLNTRLSESKSVTRIPNLGVNVHKMAYDMALSDARATGAYKKKGRKNKGRIGSEKPTGTMFSYFPLLKTKRPLSESDKVLELGVKQDEGRKVAPKNYMKHIFGNIKLSDYYPGGKKWRSVE